MPHALAIDQSAVHDQHLDATFVYGPRHLFDQFIKDGAFMPPTGNHAGGHNEKEVQLAVDVDQAHQFVAAVLLVALVAEVDLFGFHRMVVLVEPKQIRVLVMLVVGDEQVGSISDEQPLRIKQTERP